MKNYIGYIVAAFFFFSACNLTQEVEIELPDYDRQIMVESYLVPGQQFTLLLTTSFSYFAPIPANNQEYIEQLLIPDAEVLIKYADQEVKLESQLAFNPFTGKLFNYSAPIIVPEDYESEFRLEIRISNGEIITGTTYIPTYVPIDSVVMQFNDSDTIARSLTYWTDDPSMPNFYRRLQAQGTRDSVDIDFVLDDKLTDNSLLVAGTGYDFILGDTVINTIYHITPEYFSFMNSVFNADAANGNPFAQPSTILSNVKGDRNPLGIFTGLNVDERRTIVTK